MLCVGGVFDGDEISVRQITEGAERKPVEVLRFRMNPLAGAGRLAPVLFRQLCPGEFR